MQLRIYFNKTLRVQKQPVLANHFLIYYTVLYNESLLYFLLTQTRNLKAFYKST